MGPLGAGVEIVLACRILNTSTELPEGVPLDEHPLFGKHSRDYFP